MIARRRCMNLPRFGRFTSVRMLTSTRGVSCPAHARTRGYSARRVATTRSALAPSPACQHHERLMPRKRPTALRRERWAPARYLDGDAGRSPGIEPEGGRDLIASVLTRLPRGARRDLERLIAPLDEDFVRRAVPSLSWTSPVVRLCDSSRSGSVAGAAAVDVTASPDT